MGATFRVHVWVVRLVCEESKNDSPPYAPRYGGTAHFGAIRSHRSEKAVMRHCNIERWRVKPSQPTLTRLSRPKTLIPEDAAAPQSRTGVSPLTPRSTRAYRTYV